MKIVYEAYDGEIFTREVDCIEYENQTKGVYEAALLIKQFCSRKNCTSCPFFRDKEGYHSSCYFSQNTPNAWKIPNELK